MRTMTWTTLALMAGLWSAGDALAQSEEAAARPSTFAAPQLLKSGEQPMGDRCLYPSPVLHDLDGDGQREMVIGDLRGYLSVSKKTDSGWGPETKLNGADGKPLKFSNW